MPSVPAPLVVCIAFALQVLDIGLQVSSPSAQVPVAPPSVPAWTVPATNLTCVCPQQTAALGVPEPVDSTAFLQGIATALSPWVLWLVSRLQKKLTSVYTPAEHNTVVPSSPLQISPPSSRVVTVAEPDNDEWVQSARARARALQG